MSKPISQSKVSSNVLEESKNNLHIWLKLSLFIFAFILYGTTSNYDFTLDDDIFYLKHSSAQQGISAINEMFTHGSMEKFDGRKGLQPYRPITLLSFAVEKNLFDNDAAKSHLINVLIYALILIVLFNLIRKLFPNLHLLLAFIIVLLFAAHPIHTEVVASVKSRDELLAALFGFLSWSLILSQNNESVSLQHKILSAFCFALALLSKESAIAFLAVIPLSFFVLKKYSIKDVILPMLPFAVLSSLFLIIRQLVVGGPRTDAPTLILENVLHGTKSFAEATATRFEIFFYYLKLLFKPFPLSWDYSFNQIPIMDWGSVLPWVSMLLHFLILGIAFYYLRKKPIISFGIIFYLIMSLPTNNLFFINGATVAERFLFVPSFGFILVLTYGLLEVLKVNEQTFGGEKKNMFIGIIALVMLSYTVISWKRIPVWESNTTLFASGIESAPNSSRTHYSQASQLMKLGNESASPKQKNSYFEEAIKSFEKSIEILPSNTEAQYNLAILYTKKGEIEKSIQQYHITLACSSKHIFAMNNLALLFEQTHKIDSAIKYYRMAFDVNPDLEQSKKSLSGALCNQAILYDQGGQAEAAKQTFQQALNIDSKNETVLNNMAFYFSAHKQTDSAISYLQQSYQINPKDLNVIERIATLSFLNAQYDKAVDFANKGLTLKPDSKKSLTVLADSYKALGKNEEASKYQARIK